MRMRTTKAKVDEKWRVLIPKEVREVLGITPNTTIQFIEEEGKWYVKHVGKDPLDELVERLEKGKIKRVGKPLLKNGNEAIKVIRQMWGEK
ncbi:MAG: AbrB/MazE/SpoVT family DNA-binding domain-containing protein [Euryarchaeota archaeon]|nr:AbrB/MazE/SpoVT family DNA-binding domain-containing protein [Euryarchaeota archaeon]